MILIFPIYRFQCLLSPGFSASGPSSYGFIVGSMGENVKFPGLLIRREPSVPQQCFGTLLVLIEARDRATGSTTQPTQMVPLPASFRNLPSLSARVSNELIFQITHCGMITYTSALNDAHHPRPTRRRPGFSCCSAWLMKFHPSFNIHLPRGSSVWAAECWVFRRTALPALLKG